MKPPAGAPTLPAGPPHLELFPVLDRSWPADGLGPVAVIVAQIPDPADLPAEKTIYAMRDIAALGRLAAAQGPSVGAYAAALLDVDLPWTKMRQVYRLLGLGRRYGPERLDEACRKALDVERVDVTFVTRILEQAAESKDPDQRPAGTVIQGRFFRDASHFTVSGRPGGTPGKGTGR